MPVKNKGPGMLFCGPGKYEVTHLNCGCGIDKSMFYFWMWKMWRLHRVGGAVVELITSIHVAPQIRNMVYQGFQRWCGMPSGLRFTGVLAASEDENREQSVIMQFRNLARELKGIYPERGKDLSKKELVGILLNHSAEDEDSEFLGKDSLASAVNQ
jgi:hypothetical protein